MTLNADSQLKSKDIDNFVVPGGAENETISHIILNYFKNVLESGYFLMPNDSPYAEIFEDMDFSSPLRECAYVSRREWQEIINTAGLNDNVLILPFEDHDLALRLQFAGGFNGFTSASDDFAELTKYIQSYLSKIIRSHTNYLNVLNRLSRLVLSSFEIETIFPAVVDELKKIIGFHRFSLVTYHPEFDSFRLEAEYDDANDTCSFKKQFIKLNETSLARLIVRRRGLITSTKDLGQGMVAQRLIRMGYQSYLFSPIYDGAELLASLNLASRDVNAYDQNSVKLLSGICNIIGDGLKSALKHNHLHQLMDDYHNAKRHFMQLEKSRNFIDITRGVLHALNNQLALVMGRAQLLRQFSGDVIKLENAKKGLDIILNASTKASEQIAGLQKYARLKPDDEPDQIQLKGLIEEIIELSMPRWKAIAHGAVEFNVNIDTQVVIKGFRKKIKEALINILMNAVEAEEEKGGEISIRAYAEDGMAIIAVKDEGKGIDRDAIPRLFNPFYTTKSSGTGLGLAVSYRIIKEHSGKLEVDSIPDKGTTVTIRLPLKPEKTDSSSSLGSSRFIKNVVIVDQNRMRRNLLSKILEKMELRVKAVKSLGSADSLIAEEKPDLVIMDDEPGDVDPVEYFRMIKDNRPETLTCLQCSSATADDCRNLKSMGIDAVLTKPFEQDQIRKAIDALRRPSSGSDQ
jgi:signal transduction histidine kinase